MNYFIVPTYLHEIFGEKQSKLEVSLTLLFAFIGSTLLYFLFYIPNNQEKTWVVAIAFIVISDVLAGCIANFTKGTNQFYAQRPKGRLLFISIHFHILIIAWLLSVPFEPALIVWGYTIVSAFIVNAFKGTTIQLFIAANLMCYGIFLFMILTIPTWFLIVSIFFMIKIMFSFAVEHYQGVEA